MRVDRDRIGALQVRHAAASRARQARRGAVRRVHVQPQALARRHVGELADGIDRAGVRRARDRGDRERQEARRPVARDRRRDGRAAQPEVVVGRDDDERLRREAELVERPADREVGLVGRVDADALERPPARRRGVAAELAAGGRRGPGPSR